MICKRSFIPLCAAALVLASCSGDNAGPSGDALTGGDAFLELVEDARVAVRAGNLAEAGARYDDALALEPENPGLWVDIARLRFRGGEHLTAIEAADYALQLDAEYAPALLMRAQLVRDAHGLAESLTWFEAAVQADPRNAEAMADYAATLGDLGRYGDMLAVVRELAEFAPKHPQVHYLQAVLAARGEDPVLASNLLTRSGLVEQGVPAAMMLSAVVDLQQGSHDTAAETLLMLAERQPENMRVGELLARALWLGGRDRELVDRFGAQAERAEASPYLVMLVGRALERMGERRRAIPLLERARVAQERDQMTLTSEGPIPAATARLRSMAAAGNAGGAAREARAMLARAPQSGDFHALAGDAAFASGDVAGALGLYQTAAKVRRNWPLTRKIIAAYQAYDDPLAAEALLARYVAGDPHNIAALMMLAEGSAEREDWLRVEVLLDQAIALGAGSDLRVLTLRKDAARALGKDAEAERFETRLAELSPGDFLPQ